MQLTSLGNELIVHARSGASIYLHDNNRWTKIDSLQLTGMVEQIESRPYDTVTVIDSTILYSSDGIHFTKAITSPDKNSPNIDETLEDLDLTLGGGCRGTYCSSNTRGKLGPLLASGAGF